MSETINELQILVERLKTILVAYATGKGTKDNNEEYVDIRKRLIRNPIIGNKLPRLVHLYRTLDEFWGFIQPEIPSYSGRRTYLKQEFEPTLLFLEQSNESLSDSIISKKLGELTEEDVQVAWQKAIGRREIDPEGAITSARTLLETVCKRILDEDQIKYDDNSDLPKLYKTVASHIKLWPDQHEENLLKRICGGCITIVEGLGAVRNQLGDAHTIRKGKPRPGSRHATLAVNLSGTMALFLIETWKAKRQKT